jgi:hypothetical protein
MAAVDVAQIVQNYIHEGKQFSDDRKHAILTVNRIGRLSGGGALDFGGSEYAEAEISWLEPQKQSPEDKYGWWKLTQGHYRIEFNETISLPEDGSTVILFHPWPEAVKAGLNHPSVLVTAPRSPLVTHIGIGPQGISIKENARVSQVTILG